MAGSTPFPSRRTSQQVDTEFVTGLTDPAANVGLMSPGEKPQAYVPLQEGGASGSAGDGGEEGAGIVSPDPHSSDPSKRLEPVPESSAVTSSRVSRLERSQTAVRRALSDGANRDEREAKRRATNVTLNTESINVLAAEINENTHPLVLAAHWAREDVKNAHHFEADHGTWDGRWSLPSRMVVETQEMLGIPWPSGGAFEVNTTAAKSKGMSWNEMTDEVKDKFRDAAQDQWGKWVENQAIEVLGPAESKAILQELYRKNEENKVLKPRFVLTDKNSSLRTEDNPLPLKANARIVVPGFKDLANLRGELRKDAPTGSRLGQHVLFAVGAANPHWRLLGADVRAAFLKGDPYVTRELYLTSTDPKKGPTIPIPEGCLARVLKGVFGLADAPREWYLRLAREMDIEGWSKSALDGALWIMWSNDKSSPIGMVIAHVDDLLFMGDDVAEQSLMRLGQKLGFGSIEKEDFTWCGKRIEKTKEGEIKISMKPYHQQLQPVQVSRERRKDPSAALNPGEVRRLKGILGSLQWLVAQLRFDLAFQVSSLQSETPTVGALLRANKCLVEAKRDWDFELVFRNIDYKVGGIMVVSDAALGNVNAAGDSNVPPYEKVHSQSCYAVMLCDKDMMDGHWGKFNLLDFRSHRIARVCRSSYSAETLGAEEGLDAAELARGFLAGVLGVDVTAKDAWFKVTKVPLVGVTDAKDCYDRLTSDTGFGTQKSLSFTLASLRQQLRRPNTGFRWTATMNMWVDSGTKLMDNSAMRKVLRTGEWSIEFNTEFTKQTSKGKKASDVVQLLPGRSLEVRDEQLMEHVRYVAESPGWHFRDGVGIHVAQGAKSYRSPAPRFAIRDFPFRSTLAEYRFKESLVWRILEENQDLRDLANLQAQMDSRCRRLVTFFRSSSGH